MTAAGVAVGLSIGLAIGFSYSGTEDASPGQAMMAAGPSGTIDIGMALPASGDLSSRGYENGLGSKLAVVDFNEYLEEIGADWRFNLVIEDTQTDPIIALEKIQSLNSKGIKLVLGTETSAEIRNVKSYVDSNGMLLISPSSASPALAIKDNIFRLVPDDTQQGRVIATLAESRGISVIIPVYRGDVWGDGLYKSTRSSFEALGGTYDDGIRYSPESTVFSTEAHLLNEMLGGYLEDRPASEIGILLVGFEEAIHFFNSASSYEDLASVQWFGPAPLANNDILLEDPIAAGFIEDIGLISTQFAATENPTYDHVREEITKQIGRAPNTYAFSAYDSLWLIGLSILQVQSDDPERIKGVLHAVAKNYGGSLGPISLNEAGDLTDSNYALYTVRDGEWIVYGIYKAKTGEITT
ncbi:ABC-type branched-chain amino acid transport system, periplasmic component [Cenarchaeum symbiosum A]|uniref:ABC-type branched-chain amino acid transport system, periplasmic component n=1 Tax=Cenarchaeum symbiosum (strain A) TaxID=414004 RepID=A0RXB4_CENSY|nr:ABC-type branched-chain amino acid transport system, periplasmic component [Cenarchaeum symbiosum A]